MHQPASSVGSSSAQRLHCCCRFDGDGMVHAVRIKDGKALAYSNAWIDTARLRQVGWAVRQ